MVQEGYWDHYAPDGTTPWDFIRRSGYDYAAAGENLARGFQVEPKIVEAWMKSELHRANILNPGYNEVGISVLPYERSGKESFMVVVHYGQQSQDALNFNQRSTPEVTDAPSTGRFVAVWQSLSQLVRRASRTTLFIET